MAKGHSEQHHQHDQGTPTYIIMSVLFTIVIFALEGIKDTINVHGADSQTQATILGFIGLGLSICFFWRRLHDSIFKSLTAIFYTASLWAYMVATITLPLLAIGEDVGTRLQLIHQCGLGGVVIAGFSLMAALLYHQKPVPALLMTTFAGFLVAFGSLYPMLRPGAVLQNEFAIENRGSYSSKKVEIVEEEIRKTESEHQTTAAEHETPHSTHEAEPATHVDDEHGSKKSKMKLSAHAATEDSEADESEEHVHKALREANHDEAEESPAPRTLTAAQKAKLEHRDPKPAKTSGHGKPKSKKVALAAKAPASHGPHWEYSGEVGPENWGRLADAFATCSKGREQSPINITNWPTRENIITLDYKERSTFTVLDNGHTVQVNVESGNFADINGQRYELKQFHFHTPSEHLVDSMPYQMEVHFVHANDKGQLAVIGAFINPGSIHKEYQQVWKFIPEKAHEPIKPYVVALDLKKMLPATLTAFHYSGSLTTPPCSENVNWNVLSTTLKLSQDQINQFKMKYQMNARPVQPLNYRKP